MDSEDIETDVALAEILIEAYGYCDEENSDIIYGMVNKTLTKISSSGHPKTAYLQAYMPQFGQEDSDLDSRFNALIKQSSDAGVPEAQYTHACRLYERGDYSAAVDLYKVSADRGYPPSQYCYGLGLYDGLGIDKNEREGLHFI